MFQHTDSRSLSRTREREINKQQKDIYNRIHSIAEDSEFVLAISQRFPDFPVIANQRCGAWYVNPETSPTCSVYFKSTDGHDGQWQFSVRRSNLHLVSVITDHKGVLIVDSTRRGKRFPDALSKTVPAWCAVLNLARLKLANQHPIAKEDLEFWLDERLTGLSTPPKAVRASEHDQIRKKVGSWAEELLSSAFDFRRSLLQLKRPLRPVWCCPASISVVDTDIHLSDDKLPSYYTVVCVSASKLISDHPMSNVPCGYNYVQGAGDDHEAWSQDLTPKLFWKYRKRIMSTSRHDLPELFQDILGEEIKCDPSTVLQQNFAIQKTSLTVCLADGLQELGSGSHADASLTVLVSASTRQIHFAMKGNTTKEPFQIGGGVSTLKNLDKILSYVTPVCVRALRNKDRVCIIAGGTDVSESQQFVVAIVICVLVEAFDDNLLLRTQTIPRIDKALIRSRLQWMIEASDGKLNPQRSVLKRVNNHLIAVP
ncbi:hypothetical protein CROQUDRAFT_721480 [Cronartium quercuum f. sp. fusiforme G11]|uniref:Initiator tRNA phosphoribosyl transferase n=1 Tax=Cronartium quercuum f. sp. fusiforme G11 TaxID=708437 RepID=A0A9P6NRA4_9BASI|nr:hypothetical protein CROQUDRAFT_721480 [Cronartium quercuum f. sp. fusiforme G11]